jgi:dCTP deaminase
VRIVNDLLSDKGILPAQSIRELVRRGHISSILRDVIEDQIQPSSIDLRLGQEAFRVSASFLPGSMSTVLGKAESSDLLIERIDLSRSALLEPGNVYVVPLMERLSLPPNISGIANPKSTTGRLDIFTRLITEAKNLHAEFESVPKGYAGPLYLEIASRTFKVRIQEGMRLNQLRFVQGGQQPIGNRKLRELHREGKLFYALDGRLGQRGIKKRGIPITVDLEGDASGIVGYEAKKHAPPIDLQKVDHYDIEDFWYSLPRTSSGQLILKPDAFYILASKQKVRVPPDMAAEMVPHDPSMGEFRVHYAGFFDPGFGYGVDQEIPGAKAVLEVRAYEVPFLLEHDRLVGRLNYYWMGSAPEKVYGSSIGSSYQQQGLALSKQFKRKSDRNQHSLSAHDFRLVPAGIPPLL